MVSSLSKTIAGLSNQQDSMRQTQVKQDTISNYFVLSDYKLKIQLTKVQLEERTLGDAFVLGNTQQGILGTNKLGESGVGAWGDKENDVVLRNLTRTGKNFVASWLASESYTPPTHVGFGSGSGAPSEGDTTLATETGSRTNIDTYGVGTSKTVTYQSLWTEGTQRTVREVGLFDASSTGNLYVRHVFDADQTLAVSKQFRLTFTVILADSTAGTALIVDAGMNVIRDAIANVAANPPTYTEWNDTTSTPLITHTESTWDSGSSNEDRNIFTISSRVNNVVSFETLLDTTELNSVNITKSGTFNASANGTLFGQILYGSIVKTNLFQVYEIDRYTVI